MADNYRILTLDGGGIRGLITAVWLAELEKKLGSPIGKKIDLVAGTSTGSILACAIARGVPAKEIIDLYVELGPTVFPSGGAALWSRARRFFTQGPSAPKYDGDGLEAVLQAQFGNATFGEVTVPTMVTGYNTRQREALVMKSFRERHAVLPIVDVVKASCSAPTFFPAHIVEIEDVEEPLVDGGVFANNPTACAIAEAARLRENKVLDDLVVISMGTGTSTRPITADQATEWGALEWAVPIIDVLMDGASDAVDYIAHRLLPHDRYFRFQTTLDDAFDDMDDASMTNMNALKGTARAYLRRVGTKRMIESAVKLLG